MANVLNKNPVILDTADANTDLAPNICGSRGAGGGRFKINSIRWVGATDAAHAVELKDNGGHILYEDAGQATTLEAARSGYLGLWIRNGLRVATLGSGRLYLYLED